MQILKSEDEKTVTLKIEGRIDEHSASHFEALKGRVGSKDLVVDCTHITAINSIGISNWLAFFNDDTWRGTATFVEVPEVMLDVGIIIPKFFNKGRIKSFRIKSICDECNQEELHLFNVESEIQWGATCESCDSEVDEPVDFEEYADLCAKKNPA